MITIKKIVMNPLQENTYIVSDETKECVIIDCGAFSDIEIQAVVQYLENNNLTVKHLLCTHAHFDHVMGNRMLCQKLKIKPEYSQRDHDLMGHTPANIAMFLGVQPFEEMPAPERFIDANTIIHFGTHSFQVLETPGHSHGSLTFYCKEENTAFTGDTLFRMSIGRTDFPESSYEEMMHSLHEVLAKLPEDTICYPGHGPSTTISCELRTNPFLS